ncbi:hypothetical protein O1L60_03845 [Streptomyces diastatochromogenes]|nr:hypothetical protein [Streptomyces diastatochromogenes]
MTSVFAPSCDRPQSPSSVSPGSDDEVWQIALLVVDARDPLGLATNTSSLAQFGR